LHGESSNLEDVANFSETFALGVSRVLNGFHITENQLTKAAYKHTNGHDEEFVYHSTVLKSVPITAVFISQAFILEA
jgi:hypothetical protein